MCEIVKNDKLKMAGKDIEKTEINKINRIQLENISFKIE